MHPPTPQPMPLSAEFESVLESKQPGAAAQKAMPWKMSRCSDGKSMVDYGNKTVITDPNAKQTITLDHVKKEALVIPHLPGLGKLPHMPGMPQMPPLNAPSMQAPPMDVKDLGKKMIAGHEADGKLFTFHPPQVPKPPALNLPQMAGLKPPQVPELAAPQTPPPPGGTPPQIPAAPGPPKMELPKVPHTVESWTSSKLHLPLLTKTTTGTTQQTTTCKQVTPGESPKCAFKIPPDYKIIHPPSLPQVPQSPIKLG